MSESKSSKLKNKNKGKLSIKIQKKKVFRATEPLLAVFMWGVNHSVNELKHVCMPELLMPDDFKAYIKVKIDNQYFNKDVLPSHFKVKEYCPLVFKNVRERFSINDDSFLCSLTQGDLEPLENTGGKSAARFYTSYDKRYVIKTITSEDVEGLHNILTDYHKHIVETKGDTLLPHLLAIFRLTVEDKENYMIVMRNIFTHKYRIQYKYDIKGSTVDRAATQKEKEKGTPTFKDNDLLNERRTISIGAESKQKFMAKLERDVKFLSQLKLMDYSLLIGVHDADKQMAETQEQELRKQAEREKRRQQQNKNKNNSTGGMSSSGGEEGAALSTEKPGKTSALLSTSPTNNNGKGVGGGSSGDDNIFAVNANSNANRSNGDSDQDNLSPVDDTEDTDDDQLNISVPTPPDSPSSRYAYGLFGLPAAANQSNGDKKEVYFMGLIDILTHYGLKKRSANVAKTVKYGADQEISTVKPDQYSRRFLEFVNKIID